MLEYIGIPIQKNKDLVWKTIMKDKKTRERRTREIASLFMAQPEYFSRIRIVNPVINKTLVSITT